MNTLSVQQMEAIDAGRWSDAITCIGGIAGFVIVIGAAGAAAATGIGTVAAVGIIGGWTTSGLATGVGCGRLLASVS